MITFFEKLQEYDSKVALLGREHDAKLALLRQEYDAKVAPLRNVQVLSNQGYRGDLIIDFKGKYWFYGDEYRYTSTELLAIANELDRLNAPTSKKE